MPEKNIIESEDFIIIEKTVFDEEFDIIEKTNLSEPFWGKVVNKN